MKQNGYAQPNLILTVTLVDTITISILQRKILKPREAKWHTKVTQALLLLHEELPLMYNY